MKVAFIHDAPIRFSQQGEVYTMVLTDSVWKRYLRVYDKLLVCTRSQDISENEKPRYYKINTANIVFNPCKAYNSPPDAVLHHKAIVKHVNQVVSSVDACIIRLPSILGNFAVQACKELNKPYLVEVVACPWDSLWNYSWAGKILAPIMTWQTKKHVKSATHAIYVTNEFLQRRYPTNGKQTSISNVELGSVDEQTLVNRLKKITDSSDKMKLKFATTAAVNVRYKGQEYVIQALAKLKAQGILATYHLAGGGDNSYLKSVAKKFGVTEQVVFHGAIPHDKVFGLLDDIDIYIQPSKQEGLPRAVIEAMSRGCPVIGSRTGGTPELCNPKYVFENGNVEQIVDMIITMTSEMEQEAKRSFEMAKEYQKDILEERRTAFLREFAKNMS